MRNNLECIYINRFKRDDLEALLDLRVRNRQFLKSFEPVTLDSHYTLKGQQEILQKVQHDWETGSGYGFGIFLINTDQLIERVNLT